MRNCGFNEETGKCNKRCRKFGKAECPAGRCKVESDDCTDPEDPTQEECEPKESKNGCLLRNCGWNEKTGKCNKRCRKFGKAECPAGRCKVEGDDCTDPEDPTQEECEAKESKNGCLLRNCGWNEPTGKCNRKCAKFAKEECPPKRCRVANDECEPADSGIPELPPLPTDPGCYIHAPKKCSKRPEMNADWYSDNHRGSATNEAACLKRAAEYDRWCPTTGTIAEFVPESTETADPDDTECEKKRTTKNGCKEIGCRYVEDLGICERDCSRSTKEGSCRLRSCEWDGAKNTCIRDCRKNTSSTRCRERGCRWSEKTGKCDRKCDRFSTQGNCKQRGCRWSPDKNLCEDGSEATCPQQKTKQRCLQVDGCSWDKKGRKCLDGEIVQTCDPQPNRAKCEAVTGCQWDRANGKCTDNLAAPTCPEQDNKAKCLGVGSCSWDRRKRKCVDGVIVQTCPEQKNKAQCIKVSGCSWDRKSGKCIEGEVAPEAPKECKDHVNRGRCKAQKGCTWAGGKCSGGEMDCSLLAKKSQCLKEKACNWIGTVTGGGCMGAGEVVEAPKEVVCGQLSKRRCLENKAKCAWDRKKGCMDN